MEAAAGETSPASPESSLPSRQATRTELQVADLVDKWRQEPPSFARRPELKELLQFKLAESACSWVQAGSCSTYGPRPSNEDREICMCEWTTMTAAEDGSGAPTPLALFAVFDGHGGSSVSEKVAEDLAKVLHANLVQEGKWSNQEVRRQVTQKSFLDMDDSLHREGSFSFTRSGCTCVAAVIWPLEEANRHGVMLANLGDSRGLVYHRSSDLLAETVDHKPDDPEEKKRVRAAGGYVEPRDDSTSPPAPARVDGALATSRSFGDLRFKENRSKNPDEQKVIALPDIYEFEAEAGDVVILACDGVFDVLSSAEAAATVVYSLRGHGAGDGADAKGAAASLVWAALERETGDNVTCVTVKVGEHHGHGK